MQQFQHPEYEYVLEESHSIDIGYRIEKVDLVGIIVQGVILKIYVFLVPVSAEISILFHFVADVAQEIEEPGHEPDLVHQVYLVEEGGHGNRVARVMVLVAIEVVKETGQCEQWLRGDAN